MKIRKSLFIAILLALSSLTYGDQQNTSLPTLPVNGTEAGSFVPKGWRLIKQADGDLNKDGRTDIAGVIEQETKGQPGPDQEAPPRILFISFQQPGGGYRLSIQTGEAILKSDEGGVFGDPFAGLSVDRGSLVISFYGGSNDRWSYVYRFRLQNKGWFMIGATLESANSSTGEGTVEDFNLLTGKMVTTRTDADGKQQATTANRGKRKLVNLRNFDISAGERPF